MSAEALSSGDASSYFVRAAYRARAEVEPEVMGTQEEQRLANNIVYQPDAYRFAAFLGRRAGCTHERRSPM